MLLSLLAGCVNGDNPPVLVTFEAPHPELEVVVFRYCFLAPRTGAVGTDSDSQTIRNDANAEAILLPSSTTPDTEDDGLSVRFTVPHDCFDGFFVDQETGARAAFSFISLHDRGGTFPSFLHVAEAEWE